MDDKNLVNLIGKKNFPYSKLFKDSFLYALSDKVAILIFGVILVLLSNFENFILESPEFLMSKMVLFLCFLVLILSILECGYSYRIKEETLRGSNNPPLFNKFKGILHHGFKEFIIGSTYMVTCFLILWFLGLIDTHVRYSIFETIFALAILSTSMLIHQAGVINLIYRGGKVTSAFNLIQIYKLIRDVGFVKVFIVFLFRLLCDYLILASIFNEGIFMENTIFTFALNLFVTPYLTIFSERLFMLSTL